MSEVYPEDEKFEICNHHMGPCCEDSIDFLLAKVERLERENEKLMRVRDMAKEVIFILEKHGPSIVPHLMDSDDNAGQRLRDALSEIEK